MIYWNELTRSDAEKIPAALLLPPSQHPQRGWDLAFTCFWEDEDGGSVEKALRT